MILADYYDVNEIDDKACSVGAELDHVVRLPAANWWHKLRARLLAGSQASATN